MMVAMVGTVVGTVVMVAVKVIISQLIVSILVGRSRGFYQASPKRGLLPQGFTGPSAAKRNRPQIEARPWLEIFCQISLWT